MKKYVVIAVLSLLPFGLKAQLSSNPHKFLGNITTDWSSEMDYDGFVFSNYWNQVTPENATKWESVEGTRGVYNWSGADNAYKYASQHGFPFKFHTLVWGSQFPGWFKTLSVRERYVAIVKWMDAVKAKYPDLPMIDVVNEAIEGHQEDTPLMKEALGGAGVTGYDWIIRAFELAYERWPNAILIYNDFNTFTWQVNEFIDLVKTLRNAGAPIDAYGCQSHDLGGMNGTDFAKVMNRIQDEVKIPMYITEYDINDANDANQKWNYQQHIPLMWEADYCAGITLWGWMYGKTWYSGTGLVREKQERSALKWLRDYMKTDKAKNATSPFPGMVKEASVYVKPAALTVKTGDQQLIEVRAHLKTKTIDKVELYVNGSLVKTMNKAPYTMTYIPQTAGQYTLKAVVTATDGTRYNRLSSFTATNSQKPDEDFYIYLCLGQSNMEGNATPEAVDKEYVDSRFQTLACVNFDSPARTMGYWYTAFPPIVRPLTGLGMADYFGRTMVASLPEHIRVGVVDVAIGGTKIEGFMSEKVADYIAPEADWLKNYFAAYDNDPYKRLVDMARIAQQSGIIKGILLHQGESNNGESDWPQKVKTVYERLLNDLNLKAADVPLFVGETVSSAEGGACGLHNTAVAKVPDVIPTAHIISSEGCAQKGDGLHFTAAAYRTMGKRYAAAALKLMGLEVNESDEPVATEWVIDSKFTSLAEIGTTPFAIVNETEGKAVYGVKDQHLGCDLLSTAFNEANSGYLFKLENSTVSGKYLLRLITPSGTPYVIWDNPGYLNGYSTQTDCSFILGLNNQNGQDVKNGAVWDIQYVAGKGFALKNLYTGKYLKDAASAKYDQPTYFTFATLKKQAVSQMTIPSVVRPIIADDTVYSLQGIKVGTMDQWQSLPLGFYIVNGKKIVKR